MKSKKIIYTPAKINIFLKILGKRDDGLHLIRSGITFINLFDKIEIEQSYNTSIEYSGFYAPLSGTYNDCIIAKLLSFLNIKNNIKFKIKIEKNIPVQGGLGAASSNAAGVINFLNEMQLIDQKDNSFYSVIGSDVPCFLYNKNCLVEGIGNKIYYSPLPKYYFLLIKPEFNNSTKNMYEKLQYSKNFLLEESNKMPLEINDDDCGNDFEKIVQKENPEFRKIIQFLENLDEVIFARMSGSGSCCFAAFDIKKYAINAENLFNLSFPELKSYICENNYKN